MNKGLEAFRKLRKAFVLAANKDITNELDNIENELKRLEEIEKCYKEELKNTSYYNNLALKYKKTLKIIKSKEMLSVFKDIISGKCFIAFNTTAIEIPEEEYDLLKEVLL